MKILYIERSLVETSVVYDQIQRVKKTHSVYVLSVDQTKLPQLEGVKRIQYYNFPKIEKLKFDFFLKAVLKGIKKYFDGIVFNGIHAHFAYPEGFASLKLSIKLNLPYVVTLRGSDLLVYPKQSKFLYNSIAETVQKASAIIGVSQDLCLKANDMGAIPDNVNHVPDGYDDTSFFYDNSINKKNQIIFAGNLIEIKNIKNLLKAFSLFLKNFPDYKLLICGKGILEKDLKKEATSLNISNNVFFQGYVSHNELPLLLNQSKLLVLPSWSEGWPNIIQEALGCGLPVVASNVGGIPEILCEDAGYLINPNEIEDINNKMKKAINRTWDHKEIESIGLKNTKERMQKELLKIYDDYFI